MQLCIIIIRMNSLNILILVKLMVKNVKLSLKIYQNSKNKLQKIIKT